MKTIILIASLCTMGAIGQNYTTASQYINSGFYQGNPERTESLDQRTTQNVASSVTLFATLAEFQAACSNIDALTFEDFEGGPNEDFEGCGTAISSEGGICFPQGEIQEGVIFTNSGASSGANMIFINSGDFFGTANPGVSSDNFISSTHVVFTEETPVTSIAFDLYSPIGDGAIDMRIFGVDSGLMDTFTFNASSNAQFVGFMSDEPLERIELQNLDGVLIETVAQFYFGDCNEALSTAEFSMEILDVFPNPAKKELSISANSIIDTVSIFNLLGQKVLTYDVDSITPTVDISSLSKGAYILQVTSNNTQQHITILKD